MPGTKMVRDLPKWRRTEITGRFARLLSKCSSDGTAYEHGFDYMRGTLSIIPFEYGDEQAARARCMTRPSPQATDNGKVGARCHRRCM